MDKYGCDVYERGGLMLPGRVLAAQWQTDSSRVIYPYWPSKAGRDLDSFFDWKPLSYFSKYGATYCLFEGVLWEVNENE